MNRWIPLLLVACQSPAPDVHPPFPLQLPAASGTGPDSCCSDPGVLDVADLIDCLSAFMPGRGDGYLAPTQAQHDALQAAAASMLALGPGSTDTDCATIDLGTLDDGLDPIYGITAFTDADGDDHCVLIERAWDEAGDGKLTHSWGTVAVRYDAERPDLHLQIPHPRFDSFTRAQGAELYGDTGPGNASVRPKSLVIAGGHRAASDLAGDGTGSTDADLVDASACDCALPGSDCYYASDPAHTDLNLLNATTRALVAAGGAPTALQFHGNGSASCADVYLTYGEHGTGYDWNGTTGVLLTDLHDAIEAEQPSWAAQIPDDTCSLHGSGNIQGRLLNGIPEADLCDFTVRTTFTSPAQRTDAFVHIEQSTSGVLATSDRTAANWDEALRDAFPPPATGTTGASTGTGSTTGTGTGSTPSTGTPTDTIHSGQPGPVTGDKGCGCDGSRGPNSALWHLPVFNRRR